jgi:hypothetical protein
MKSKTALLLAAAVLAWLLYPSIAAAQAVISWSETAYDHLVPANSSKTIPPGTLITAKNWHQYRDFMPIGMQGLWEGKYFWRLPANAEMKVVAWKSIPLPKIYQEDTEKYSGQVSLVKQPDGGYNIKGYVAGAPFPHPSGPLAGVEIMYNEYYAYIPYLITTYTTKGFEMDRYGNKYVTDVREVNFKVRHVSDPGKPVTIPTNTPNVFLTQNNVIMEPEQSKYINSLQIFHDNPADLPESYVFLPSLRRSLRLTTAARCSPLVGSDYTQDDERSMNLQPPIFQARFLGYKKILVGYPLNPGYTIHANYYKPLYFPSPKAVVWMLRPVAVLDIRRVPSMQAGYCYGSRMAFIDQQTWQPIWMDLYDTALHLWKIGPSIYLPMPLPGTQGDVATGAGGPGNGDYMFWDLQNEHLTFDIQNGGQIDQNAGMFDNYERWGTPGGMDQVMQ